MPEGVIQNDHADELYQAMVSLKNTSEAARFLRDLCTREEIRAMGERLQIAKMLSQGASYREIAEDLRVSTTTVRRVADWFSGGTGGYRLVLGRISRK